MDDPNQTSTTELPESENEEENVDQEADTEPEPIILSGEGNTATEQFELQEGLVVFEMEHTDDSDLRMDLLNEQGETEEWVISNTVGRDEDRDVYEGREATHVETGTYLLDIDTDEGWNITITQPQPDDVHTLPHNFSGEGTEVTEFFRAEDGLTRFEMEYNGDRLFQVQILDENGERTDGLANEVGEFNGSTATNLEEGIYLINVVGDGDWEISAYQEQ